MTSKLDQQTSEANGNNLSPVADLNVESSESVEAPIDPMAQLQADFRAAKSEVAEWQDRFLRKAAEFENFRKRSEKERLEAAMLSKGSVLTEFLPILDACERALESFGVIPSAPAGLQQYQEGVELLYKQMLDTMGRSGVVPIETEGKPFDPHLHEALSRQETAELEENTIVRELRRGYMFRDRLLRPAQVIVAAHPAGKD
jgi:molecular chaperone GrpE